MLITILICTRNRTESLRQTLESIFIPTTLREPAWEVVVVYNGADFEASAEVCGCFQTKFPARLHFLVEATVGKSHALNRGIIASEGDIVAMTDDDVCCGPNYVQGIRSVFNNNCVDAAQGRVLLDCEGGRPDWMNDEMAAFMSLRDCGDKVLEWNDNLTGANMIVRRDVIREIGGFSTAIGAGAAGFMEDSEFSVRMRRAKFRTVYAPQIMVWHRVPRERLSHSFFLERYFRWGRSDAYLRALPYPIWKFARFATKELVRSETIAIWNRISRHSVDLQLELRCKARYRMGFLWQHWRFIRGIDNPTLGGNRE